MAVYFCESKPKIGDAVIIVIDSANWPTGIWGGKLTCVGDGEAIASPHVSLFPGAKWTHCKAIIIDPAASGEWPNAEPRWNYDVYTAETAPHYFRFRIERANEEIRGLKRRIEIEREVFHGLLKSIVNAECLAKLEKFVNEFIARLGR